MPKPLLEIRDLQTSFDVEGRQATAVSEVSFDVNRNEFLGIVGESGSGKSVTALSIMRLIPDPPGRIDSGTIHYEGRDLLALSYEEMREVRGKDIAMIFQEPMTSLNPVLTIGFQIAEALIRHRGLSRSAAEAEAQRAIAAQPGGGKASFLSLGDPSFFRLTF